MCPDHVHPLKLLSAHCLPAHFQVVGVSTHTSRQSPTGGTQNLRKLEKYGFQKEIQVIVPLKIPHNFLLMQCLFYVFPR